MVIVDLITGFLGAGKTTFIHRYLQYLKEKGQSVRMIENEFGDVSVDSQLLKEDHCQIDDLAGLCMCCVGKDAFIQMLLESGQSGCDRVIVEPSGIYDVDEFFEVMSLPQVSAVCEIGSIITVVDTAAIEYLTDEAKYLLFAQLLASGMVLLSKTQWMSPEEIEESRHKLDMLMEEKGCPAGLMAEVCTKSWDSFANEDFEEMMDSAYSRFVHDREQFSHSEVFQSIPILGHCFNAQDLKGRIEALFNSPACGRIYRIKGFLSDEEGNCYQVNCTMNTYSAISCEKAEEVLVVIGQQIHEREIKELFSLRNTQYYHEK